MSFGNRRKKATRRNASDGVRVPLSRIAQGLNTEIGQLGILALKVTVSKRNAANEFLRDAYSLLLRLRGDEDIWREFCALGVWNNVKVKPKVTRRCDEEIWVVRAVCADLQAEAKAAPPPARRATLSSALRALANAHVSPKEAAELLSHVDAMDLARLERPSARDGLLQDLTIRAALHNAAATFDPSLRRPFLVLGLPKTKREALRTLVSSADEGDILTLKVKVCDGPTTRGLTFLKATSIHASRQ